MSPLTQAIMFIIGFGILFGLVTGADFNNSFLIDLINGFLPEGINTNGDSIDYREAGTSLNWLRGIQK